MFRLVRKLQVRNGYVKMWRLGTLKFGEQSRWSRAPRNRGMWAFPYPFYDPFFTYHQYTDLVPKRLRELKNEDYEGMSWEEMSELSDARDKWVKEVGQKVLPVREFWYSGELFSHFTPAGEVGDTGLFHAPDVHWSVMDATKFAKHIVSSGADHGFYRFKETEPFSRVRTSIDHMEVFIAPNMGRVRDKL